MFIRKLAFSNFAARKSRVALTVAAVALSVSLVVSVTSGYASLFEAAFKFLNMYMGSVDAHIDKLNDPIGVPWQIVDELRKDPQIRVADGRVEAKSYVTIAAGGEDKPTEDKQSVTKEINNKAGDGGSVTDGRSPDTRPTADKKEDAGDAAQETTKSVRVIGIDRPSDRSVERVPMESGAWFNTPDGDVAVVDQVVAGLMHVKVGDSFTLPYLNKSLKLKVVGIAHKPAVVAAHIRSVYVPVHTVQKLLDKEGLVSTILIDFSGDVNAKAFAKRWREKLAIYGPSVRLHLTSDIRSQMDGNLEGLRILSYLGSAISMLAATFIVFSALSMGVAERQRSLAMLRAVGAYKEQIGALVVFEGLILACAGLLVGVPMGWLWIKVLSFLFPLVFTAGVVLSGSGVIFGVVGTLITALAASLLPAWTATRVRPLEAMSPLSNIAPHRAPVGWAALGLLLLAVDPFLFFGPLEKLASILHMADPSAVARQWKFYGHFATGLECVFAGYFLVAPMCVWITEQLAGPLVARVFGVQYALLRQQLSSGLWRAAGTCAALMVGLAVLLVQQISGGTMLNGWKLPDKFPDVFIGTSGLTPAEQQDLAATPGIRDIMPITIATTVYGGKGGSPFSIAGSMLVPNATMFIGIDPDKAFDMMELDFRQGNASDAKARLKDGDWVIVTQEYQNISGAKIGDSVELGKKAYGLHKFRIAAVVWSPGLDVMASMYDMGDQLEQRTISSVFGSLSDSQKYFGGRAYVFAAELKPGLERVDLIRRIKKDLNFKGLQVGDVREIKRKIQEGFFHLLRLMSVVAFAAMAVASLGVTNTVMAGVRSRRWQFGILRAVGVTRSQLLRLVLAEALLLGVIGSILGTAAGFELSADANALAAVVTGYKPPLVVPWSVVIIGISSVLLISILASIWPAVEVARTEPLKLLQAGRAST